jgi:hypothetical protein
LGSQPLLPPFIPPSAPTPLLPFFLSTMR